MTPPATVRVAEPCDVPEIHRMIGEIAEFEKLTRQFEGTSDQLHDALFGERRAVEGLVADTAGAGPVGYALFFPTFSSFLCRQGLWLEDLFVREAWRGRGIGKALFQAVATIACERGCGRFEWSVLDWNQRAIDLYEGAGATVLPDWRIARIEGDALARLGRVDARRTGEEQAMAEEFGPGELGKWHEP